MGVADSQTFFHPTVAWERVVLLRKTGCFVFIKERRKSRRELTLRSLSSAELRRRPHRFIQLVDGMRHDSLALSPIW